MVNPDHLLFGSDRWRVGTLTIEPDGSASRLRLAITDLDSTTIMDPGEFAYCTQIAPEPI